MREAEEIRELLKDFYKISGFRVSIHDPEYNEIYSYPEDLSTFCAALQENPTARAACVENDQRAFAQAEKSGKATVYHCHCGLIESVTPIYNFGVLSGFMMIGQIMDDKPNTEKRIAALSRSFLPDADDRVRIIPKVSEERLPSYLSLMTVVAEYITRTNKLHSGNKNTAALLKEYLDLNYGKKLTLSSLCRKFDCCKSTLMADFKHEYHTTVNVYLNEVRLSAAAKRLVKTNRSVKEIASECGFSGQNYFTRVFGEKFGMTPTDYRKKHFVENKKE